MPKLYQNLNLVAVNGKMTMTKLKCDKCDKLQEVGEESIRVTCSNCMNKELIKFAKLNEKGEVEL